MFRLIGETNINFLGIRKVTYILSLILVIVGLFGLVMIWTGQANLGIDFAGGVMVTGYFEQPVAIEDLRGAVTKEFDDAEITDLKDFEKPNAFIIKTKRPETEAEGEQKLQRLNQLVSESFPGNAFTRVSEHVIGPAVGQTLRKDAQKAILLSLFGIIVYLWIRFDFRSGVVAALATLHDTLVVIGIIYILGMEFDLLIVTALLTLAGYSLNDKVVIYDRIRENLKRFRTRGEFAAMVNASINEVLSRTINTGMTVLLVLGALYFLGGEVLKGFAFSLLIGIVIGTYSSIFVASPIVVEWESRRPKRLK
jgi:preprotein translocase subunit SecF